MQEPSDQFPSDDELVAAALRGEAAAFAKLFDRHFQHLHTYVAFHAPPDPHLIDELAHEAFVFAFRRLAEFAPGSSVQAWLRTIARNLVRAAKQRFSREQHNLARYAEYQAWEETTRCAEQQVGPEVEFLEECVNETPENLRALLNLKYREELSTEEMAVRVSRSAAWVRTTLFRLRQQLKECVERKLTAQRLC